MPILLPEKPTPSWVHPPSGGHPGARGGAASLPDSSNSEGSPRTEASPGVLTEGLSAVDPPYPQWPVPRSLLKKGAGLHLGVNLLILRGHGFNSSAAPPLGSRLSVTGFLSPALCLQPRLLSPLSPLSLLSPRLNRLGRPHTLNGLPLPLPAASFRVPPRFHCPCRCRPSWLAALGFGLPSPTGCLLRPASYFPLPAPVSASCPLPAACCFLVLASCLLALASRHAASALATLAPRDPQPVDTASRHSHLLQ